MSRPRTPKAKLAATGGYKNNPGRAAARANEPKAEGVIGDPSPDLPPDVQNAWREIVAECAPGVLGKSDRIAVRSAARLLARENEGKITTQERTQLHKCLENFGMTPRGRSYVHVPMSQEKNEFSQFGRRHLT